MTSGTDSVFSSAAGCPPGGAGVAAGADAADPPPGAAAGDAGDAAGLAPLAGGGGFLPAQKAKTRTGRATAMMKTSMVKSIIMAEGDDQS